MDSLGNSSSGGLGGHPSATATPISVEQVDYPIGTFVDAPAENYVLCLVQHGSGQIRSTFANGRPVAHSFRRGMFVPMTTPDTRAEFSTNASMRHLVTTLHPSTFECWAKDRGPSMLQTLKTLQERAFDDPLLEEIVCAIWVETQTGGKNGELFRDAMQLALAGAILRKAGDDAHNRNCSAQRISDLQLSLITDYLRHNMSEKIRLVDLSSLVDMHERSFSAAFKGKTGQTPYQYLLDIRIERARSMLHSSTATILQIAHDTGFADQAHLTAVFTRRVGVPPAHYRRETMQ